MVKTEEQEVLTAVRKYQAYVQYGYQTCDTKIIQMLVRKLQIQFEIFCV